MTTTTGMQRTSARNHGEASSDVGMDNAIELQDCECREVYDSNGQRKTDGDKFSKDREEIIPSSRGVMEEAYYTGEEWYLHMMSGDHMCPHKSWFESFKEEKGEVLVDHMYVEQVCGSGQISIRMGGGYLLVLQEVKYVPNLKRNCISLDELLEAGYSLSGRNSCIKITQGNLVCMRGVWKDGRATVYGTPVYKNQEVSTCTPVERMEDEVLEESNLLELLGEEQVQNLLCWKKTSALDSKDPMAAICFEDPFFMVGFEDQDMEQGWKAWRRLQDNIYQFYFSCVNWDSNLHKVIFERNGSTYLSNIVQNQVFDPGGKFKISQVAWT